MPAMEAAGRAVYMDPQRPDGYLVLGDLNLGLGDLEEARAAFHSARSKAGRVARDGGGEELLTEALTGLARCDLLAGAHEQALGSLRRVLESDPEDRGGVRQLVAEVELQLGRPAACLDSLTDLSAAQADGWLVSSLANFELGRLEHGAGLAHGALLRNPYLPACLVGEDPPDLGIVHGAEGSDPTFAADVAERLAPWLEEHHDVLDAFCRAATTPLVMEEVSDLVEAARGLNREEDAAIRASLIARVTELRDPERIMAQAPRVASQMNSGGPPTEV